jgi:transcriptional regulator with XRE-family HTH domain
VARERIARGMSQAALAAVLGRSESGVRKIERSRVHPAFHGTLANLATAFGLTMDDVRKRLAPEANAAILPVGGSVKLYGTVSASRLKDGGNHEGEIRLDPKTEFGVRVVGDCMAPRYLDGDKVICDRVEFERDGFRVGKDYAVSVGDGTYTTFKRAVQIGGGTVLLRCLNPAHAAEEIKLKLKDVVSAGVARRIVRDV